MPRLPVDRFGGRNGSAGLAVVICDGLIEAVLAVGWCGGLNVSGLAVRWCG